MNPRAFAFTWLAAAYLAPFACAHQPSPAFETKEAGREIAGNDSRAARTNTSRPPATTTGRSAAAVTNLSPPDPVEPMQLRAQRSGEPGSGGDELERDALVQTWIAEARWHRYRDHAAQAWILTRWARRMGFSLVVAIDLRVRRFSRPPRWISRVHEACTEPAGWPARWQWSEHADDCRALYARADAFMRGEVGDPCRGMARGWRAPGPALEAALALGRVKVWCGAGMANGYVR